MRLRPLLPLLVLTVGLTAGCRDVPPTSPRLQARVAGLFEEAALLPVGASLTLTGANAQAVFLDGGPEGAEFLYLPFSAATAGSISLTVLGGNVLPPAAPASLGLGAGGAGGPALSAGPLPDEDFHRALRERERRELARLRTPGERPAATRERSVLAQRVPAVGERTRINTSLDFCLDPVWRDARVAAVTERAIVLHDLANPPGGFTDAQYQAIGATFDALLYPVSVRNFGEPTDIDGNQRVVIFYTRAVNELTLDEPGSFVAGFFYVRDLIPRAGVPGIGPCPGSNEAEIFYMLAPGAGGGFPDPEGLRTQTLGTVIHEFQHLINASRRIYVNDAETLEEVWLDEALSHVAEELAFYEASGLGPRRNLDLDDLRASRRALDAANTYQVQNVLRYTRYLETATAASPMGPDDLATRGSAWAYLRYVADQRGAPETPFFFQLVNSRTSGIQNLSRVLERDPLDLMRTWSAAVLTDDAVPGLPPLLTQPSWNFRSVVPALRTASDFPLQVEPLQPETERQVTLTAGSAAYLRFRVGANQRAIIVANPDGAPLAPTLRVELVRVR
jgi:hypothetical protein